MNHKEERTERLSHIGEPSQTRDPPLLLGLTVMTGSDMVTGKVMLDRISFPKKKEKKKVVIKNIISM